MHDLEIEKYRLKATIARSEANVERNWEKFRGSFTFSNLSELLGEQLFPGRYSNVKNKFSQISGIWNGVISGLLDRLFDRFASKKD